MATNRINRATTSPTATYYLQADETTTNPGGNTSVVRCYLVCKAGSASGYAWHDGTVTGSIDGHSFSVTKNDADFATGSLGWTKGPYDVTVTHNADGSRTANLSLVVSYPHAGSGNGTTTGTLKLTTLVAPPGVPTGVSLRRDSDTQSTGTWTRNEPSNGVAKTIIAQTQVNGAAWTQVASVNAVSSLVISSAANRKTVLRVQAVNTAGSSAWSSASTPVWTTPAAPTGVAASRDTTGGIQVGFTSNVAYSEHQHVIQHGITDGGTALVWDPSPLVTLPAGVTTWTHNAPSGGAIHIYRVAAKTTDVSGLQSVWASSNQVVLIAAPNPPALTVPQTAAANRVFDLVWSHQPIDTTAQTFYEAQWSTDGGTTWVGTGKTASTMSSRSFPTAQWAPGQTVSFRVRTWGQATTGGSDNTGGSAWSTLGVCQFWSAPLVAIITPTSGTPINQSTLDVALSFSQPQGATLVQATIDLYQDGTLIETVLTTTPAGTRLATKLVNGATYQLKVTARDSNNLVSDQVAVVFTVEYASPPAPQVDVAYLPESGWAQLNIAFPPPGGGEVPGVAYTITRTINNTPVVLWGPVLIDGPVTVMDTTPTINGVNLYEVTTWSAENSGQTTADALETTETRRVFIARGENDGWVDQISFVGNLKLGLQSSRNTTLQPMSSQYNPVAMFGVNRSRAVTGTVTLTPELGSTPQQVDDFLAAGGRCCYRDPSGARRFGVLQGSISDWSAGTASFSYTLTDCD